MKSINLLGLLVIFVLGSCKKSDNVTDNNNSNNNNNNIPALFGNQGQLYFDVDYLDSSLIGTPGPCGLHIGYQIQTVCYDIEHDTLIWKTNDSLPTNLYGRAVSISSEFDSYNLYAKDNYLYRVYPSSAAFIGCTPPSSYDLDGVYFEKINKFTGERALLRKIISASEMAINNHSCISNIIFDGNSSFFFSNNSNNSIYRVDLNGNITWQNNSYILSVSSGEGESSIYYQSGKILFTTNNNNVIVCLDASNGNQIWQKTLQTGNRGIQLHTTNKYVFTFDPGIRRTDLNTGTELQFYYGPNSGNEDYIGTDFNLGDSTVTFIGLNYNLNQRFLWVEQYSLSHPSGQTGNRLSYDGYLYGKKLYNGKLFGVENSPTSFIFDCLDPLTGDKVWEISLPRDPSMNTVVTDFFYKNNSIYLITNFKVSDNQIIMNNSINLIKIHPEFGAIIDVKRVFKKPSISAYSGVYGSIVPD